MSGHAAKPRQSKDSELDEILKAQGIRARDYDDNETLIAKEQLDDYITQLLAQEYQRGLDDALGALPKKLEDESYSSEGSVLDNTRFNLALDQARKAIEELRQAK